MKTFVMFHNLKEMGDMQEKAKKQVFFIKFSPLIPEYLGRIKIIRIKWVRSIYGGVVKGKGSKSK